MQDQQPGERAKADQRALLFLLPAVAAFVDSVCYLGLFKTLTAFISGATILLATELVQDDEGHDIKAAVLVGYVVSSVGWVILMKYCLGWRHVRALLFALEAGLLALFIVVAGTYAPLSGPSEPDTIRVALISVLAMSLHNAHAVKILRVPVTTIAITSTFQNFVICAVEALGSRGTPCSDEEKAVMEARGKLGQYLRPLTAFVVGAMAGAVVFRLLGFAALVCPIGVLLVLAAISIRRVNARAP